MKNILLLILSVLASCSGSILKFNHVKVPGDILLAIGSVLFVYLFIYFLKHRKLY